MAIRAAQIFWGFFPQTPSLRLTRNPAKLFASIEYAILTQNQTASKKLKGHFYQREALGQVKVFRWCCCCSWQDVWFKNGSFGFFVHGCFIICLLKSLWNIFENFSISSINLNKFSSISINSINFHNLHDFQIFHEFP